MACATRVRSPLLRSARTALSFWERQLATEASSASSSAADTTGNVEAKQGGLLPTRNYLYDELYCRHRNVLELLEVPRPYISQIAVLAPSATIVGDVDINDHASVWYNAVIRGDLSKIVIGAFTNVQDGCVIHAAKNSPTGLSAATQIGCWVTIGSNSCLRSCIVEDFVAIGTNCMVCEGSIIESKSALADRSVLPPGRRVPSGELWGGIPARYIRDLSADEKDEIKKLADETYKVADEHDLENSYLPFGSAYRDVEKLKAALASKEKA